MDTDPVVTPDRIPETWPAFAPPTTCVCAQPVAQTRAERKGAARTYCLRCGLPVPISFGRR